MKKFSFLALAAAGMLFAACSSDKDVAESSKLNQYDMIEGQSAWIAVGIALPGDEVTRSNSDLNDGLESEFAVQSGRLVLFRGTSEDDAVLLKDYDITSSLTFANESGDNVPEGNTEGSTADKYGEITSTSTKIVQEIEAPSLGSEDNLYAYVILNDKDNTTNIAYTEGQKFSVFKVQVLKAIGIAAEAKGYGAIGTKGLVMTSVPIVDKPGGTAAPDAGAKVTTLAKVDADAIYTTKAAAEAGTAVACLYVERAAVKVEVDNAVIKIQLDGGTNLDCTFNGWALGNTNNSTSGYYNTRQFDATWMPYNNAQASTSYLKYRMVGHTNFFNADHTTAYRTYFGSDVNYDSNTGLNNTAITDADYTLGTGDVTYTYENTFDENSQTYKNTTYVGFKVTIDGGTFYTIDGQPNTRLATAADLSAAVATNAAATISAAVSAIEAAVAADLASATPTLTTGVKFHLKPVVTVTTGSKSATTGEVAYTYTLETYDVTDLSDAALSSADQAAFNTIVTATLATSYTCTAKLYEYTGGVTYYATRIAHFGGTETPWSAPNEAYNNYDKIYPTNGQSIHDTPVNYGTDRANAWLGRWGIVRNNWYRITVNSIQGLGSPVPEDFSGDVTPDDNPNPSYFIAAHIHILPWAVRKQSVDLK